MSSINKLGHALGKLIPSNIFHSSLFSRAYSASNEGVFEVISPNVRCENFQGNIGVVQLEFNEVGDDLASTLSRTLKNTLEYGRGKRVFSFEISQSEYTKILENKGNKKYILELFRVKLWDITSQVGIEPIPGGNHDLLTHGQRKELIENELFSTSGMWIFIFDNTLQDMIIGLDKYNLVYDHM